MMNKYPLIALLFVLSLQQATACLNGDSKYLKDGTYLYEDRNTKVPFGHQFNKSSYRKSLVRLQNLYNTSGDLDYLSDKGLVLILMKRYREAIKLYQKIERMSPNRYSTASNMGTAYELMGQNDSALLWIKKSVEIDPNSHQGSEWIHVNILEAKIKGDAFITTEHLLNTDFGTEIVPAVVMKVQQLEDLQNALYYQLQERVSFVKPKDKIVAQLMFDLGNIAYLVSSHWDALEDYKQAKAYGFTDKLLDQRMQLVENELNAAKPAVNDTSINLSNKPSIKAPVQPVKQPEQVQNSPLKPIIWMVGIVVAFLILVLIYKRLLKRKK